MFGVVIAASIFYYLMYQATPGVRTTTTILVYITLFALTVGLWRIGAYELVWYVFAVQIWRIIAPLFSIVFGCGLFGVC